MAIIVRHVKPSFRTQSSDSGIISKDEWNKEHYIETPFSEEYITFGIGATPHDHDGTRGSIAAKVKSVLDTSLTSYVATGNYRTASSKPQANQIPILDSNGYLNIKRVGTNRQSNFRVTDGSDNVKCYFGYDWTDAAIRVQSATSNSAALFYDSGEVNIYPTLNKCVNIVHDNGAGLSLYCPNVTTSSSYINFYRASTSYGSLFGVISDAAPSINYIGIRSQLKTDYTKVGAQVSLTSQGDIILGAGFWNSTGISGTGGKAYYKAGFSNAYYPGGTASEEIAVKGDIPSLTYKPNGPLAFDSGKLPAACTVYDMTGLDINTDVSYHAEFFIEPGSSTSTLYRLYLGSGTPNTDYNRANYYCNFGAYDCLISDAGIYTGWGLCRAYFTVDIMLSQGGYALVCYKRVISATTGGLYTLAYSIRREDAIANITSLRVEATVGLYGGQSANGIGANSRFMVYRKKYGFYT